MIINKLLLIIWAMLFLIGPAMAVEILPVESSPTKALVGHKPTFKKFDLSNAAPKAGDMLSVITEYDDLDGDKEVASAFDWYISDVKVDDQWGKTYTLPLSSGGKKLVVKATPKSESSAYPAIGDEYATQTVTIAAVPTLDLFVSGYLQAGTDITCGYKYQANGGGSQKSIRYQYGEKGTTSTLSNSVTTTELALKPYAIKRNDIGKSLECSLQAINLEGIAGPVATYTLQPTPDSSPEKGTVKIVYDNPSTVTLNSVDDHPVVNKSTLKAEFKVKAGLLDIPSLFYFDWKVGGVSVQKGNGLNTYKAPVDKQNQTVTVNVTPAE